MRSRSYFRRLVVERLLHLRFDALLPQRLLVFLAQERVLQPIRNSGPALGHVDRALVGVLLTGHAGLVLAVIVRPVPADQPQRLLADAEMRVEPVAPIGSRGDHADGLVILAIDVLGLSVLPGRHPVAARPSIRVALAFEAHEYGR